MDKTKLKNNKYFHGQYANSPEYSGWFAGSFLKENHPCKNDHLEIGYFEHQKGGIAKAHYHQQKVELLIIIAGKAKYKVNDEEIILNQGDFLFVDVNNIISGEFLEPTKLFAIHSPSIARDKVMAG